MLSEELFSKLMEKHKITDEGIDLINLVRTTPPVRRVRTNGKNNIARFASGKMRFTIQAESSLELNCIHALEADQKCYEYYSQPIKLKFKSGNRSVNYTPDFFSIFENETRFTEAKLESELKKLVKKKPERYSFDESSGVYKSESVQNELAKYGIKFNIVTDASYTNIFNKNQKYLMPYFGRINEEDDDKYSEAFEKVDALLQEKNIISFCDIFSEFDSISVNDLLNMIVRGYLYVDLDKYNLKDRDVAYIARSKSAYDKFKLIMPNDNQSTSWNGGVFVNDSIVLSSTGERYKVFDIKSDKCFCLNKYGDEQSFKISDLFEMLNKNILVIENNNKGENKLEYLKNIQEKDMDVALNCKKYLDEIESGTLRRSEVCKEYDICGKTITRKLIAYKESEDLNGNGILGLIPNISGRGNRNSRYTEEQDARIEKHIDEDFLTFKGTSYTASHARLLLKNPDIKISLTAYIKRVKKRSEVEIIEKREGKKKALNATPHIEDFGYRTERHGVRFLDIVHIDHTQIDVEVCIDRGISIRPWLSVAMCAHTRMVIAYLFTFWSPNKFTLMQLLRKCVADLDRLPDNVIVDGGKEFESEYFETLCAMYHTNILSRKSNPRKGSLIERWFLTSQHQVFHELQGNTKLMKDPRCMTKSNDPKRLAIWTLDMLDELVDKYLKIYSQTIHPALGETPIEAYRRSLIADGECSASRILDKELFYYHSMVPVDKKSTRVIQKASGVKVSNHYYWHDIFVHRENISKRKREVEVKIDVFKPKSVFCRLDGKFYECVRRGQTEEMEESKYYHLFDFGKPKNIKSKGFTAENKLETRKALVNTINKYEEKLTGRSGQDEGEHSDVVPEASVDSTDDSGDASNVASEKHLYKFRKLEDF